MLEESAYTVPSPKSQEIESAPDPVNVAVSGTSVGSVHGGILGTLICALKVAACKISTLK